MNNITISILSFLILLCSFGCTELNSGYPSSYGGYSSGGYSGGYRDPYYRGDDYYAYRERERIRREQRELDEERDRLHRERDYLERQKRKNKSKPPVFSRVPVKKPDRCPSGFFPSEQKCTKKERKRGCKDMRTPGGMGCKSL